jgi:hypothetical protein
MESLVRFYKNPRRNNRRYQGPSSAAMSEVGQSLPKRDVRTTSALPLIATSSRTR